MNRPAATLWRVALILTAIVLSAAAVGPFLILHPSYGGPEGLLRPDLLAPRPITILGASVELAQDGDLLLAVLLAAMWLFPMAGLLASERRVSHAQLGQGPVNGGAGRLYAALGTLLFLTLLAVGVGRDQILAPTTSSVGWGFQAFVAGVAASTSYVMVLYNRSIGQSNRPLDSEVRGAS